MYILNIIWIPNTYSWVTVMNTWKYKYFLMDWETLVECSDLSPRSRLFPWFPDLGRMPKLCHLLKVSSAMSTGQDPTHVIAHFPGRGPRKNRVMCLVHGGKSIPRNVTLRGPWGTGRRVFPFSAKGRSSWGCRVVRGQMNPMPTQGRTQNPLLMLQLHPEALRAAVETTGYTLPILHRLHSFPKHKWVCGCKRDCCLSVISD